MNETQMKNNIHKNHRARMKLSYLKSGFASFSDIEKLEFILFYAIGRKDTNPIAHRLLDEYKTFDKVLEAPVEALARVDGLGEHSAILLHLFLDVLNEYGKSKCESYISTTSEAKRYSANLYNGIFVEEFYVVCLATNNKVLLCKKIRSGTVSEVNVEMKEIVSIAISNNCERIILIHNHPNGLALPSDEDISFTAKIVINCILNDIEIIDHIIVGQNKQFSFEESQILSELKKDAIRQFAKTSKLGTTSSNYKII